MRLSFVAFCVASALVARRAVSILPDETVAAVITGSSVSEGQEVVKPKRQLFSSHIVGGTQASQGAYPFFVEWDQGSCGATLIWDDIILSAAHCDQVPGNDVLVGAYQTWQASGGAVFRAITQRVIHPNYNSNTMNYDFLVMKLNSPVSATPVNLNGNANYPVSNQMLTVIGLGTTTQGGSEPAVLRQVSVPYVDTQTCSIDLRESLNPALKLCAGSSGKDSCQGDSGGPIMDANNVQVGVVSYGNGCGNPGNPGVYSRVSGVLGWINQQVCMLSSNPPPSCNGGTPTTPIAAPVPSPVKSPTRAPVAAPVSSPVKAPTQTPVKTPVSVPTRPTSFSTPSPTTSAAPTGNTPTPTSSGRAPVTGTPAPSISAAPSGSTTSSPTISPTLAPTGRPTRKPSLKPTSQPTFQPVAATSTTPGGPANVHVPAGFCFSETNTVDIEGKGIVAIRDLKIGDKVRSSDGDMTTVYSFGHYKHQTKAEYLQIYTSGLAKPLELSKDHMLFVNGVAKPSSAVAVGDKLDSAKGRGSAVVKKIVVVTRKGAYAPFTTSGTIMVSGIAASSFVSLQENSSVLVAGQFETWLSWQWLAHVFETPHRLACMWSMDFCKAETYSNEGISKWVEAPLHASRWLIQQNVVVMALLFGPALLLWLMLSVVEMSIHNNSWVISLMALIAIAIKYQTSRVQHAKCKSV